MGVVPRAACRILADEIVEAIRDAIVSGQLKSGERLPESALANSLRVSRGPYAKRWPGCHKKGLSRSSATVEPALPGSALTRLTRSIASGKRLSAWPLNGFAGTPRPTTSSASRSYFVSAISYQIRCRSRTSPTSMLRSTTLSSKRLIMNDFTRPGFPCVLKFYYYSLAVESFVNTRLNRGGRTTRTSSKYLSVLNRQRL